MSGWPESPTPASSTSWPGGVLELLHQAQVRYLTEGANGPGPA